jgi:hypothetical protein
MSRRVNFLDVNLEKVVKLAVASHVNERVGVVK